MELNGYIEKYLNPSAELLSHARQSEKLAMSLYEQLNKLSQISEIPQMPELLRYGALLHDIGMQVSPGGLGHNKVGANIVVREGIEGLSEEQTYVVACLIRYHRGTTPKKTHRKYSLLNKDLQRVVKVYCSIIRLADALDWKHKNRIQEIDIKIEGSNAILTLHSNKDILTKRGFLKFFGKKKEFFEKVFKLTLTLKTPD